MFLKVLMLLHSHPKNENMKKRPSKVAYFNKIEGFFLTALSYPYDPNFKIHGMRNSLLYILCAQVDLLNGSEISAPYFTIVRAIIILIKDSIPIIIFITCIPLAIRVFINLIRIWYKGTVIL